MTSGVGDVKLSRGREIRNDSLANICAGECSYVTGGGLAGAGLGHAGALGSVNRMAAASTTR